MLFVPTIAAQMSGSIGGVCFSHGRGGPYARLRVTPTNPGSVYQSTVRAALAQLSNLWQDTLTAPQRAAWDAYADQVAMVNAIGGTIYLTGINHYVRSNTPRIQVGLDRVDVAPIIYNVGSFTEPSYAADAGLDQAIVTFDNTDAWANEDDSALLIFASVPKSPTINYFKGPFRFIGSILGDAITPPTSPANLDLTAPIADGQRTFFRATCTRADGRYSYSIFDQVDATTA